MAVEVSAPTSRCSSTAPPSPSTSGRWIEVRSPATRELVGRVPDGRPRPTSIARSPSARAAFADGRWHRMAMPERVAIMNRLGDLLDRDADELARLETLQTGTTYKLRRESDFAFASDNLRFFATQIRHLEGKAAYEYSGQPHELRPPRTDRRRGPGQPLELPDVDGDLEDRPGAGGGELDRPQARVGDAADHRPSRGAGARRPGIPDGRAQRGHRAAATSSGRRWRRTWTSTSSRSPGTPRPASGSRPSRPSNLKRVHLELGGKAPFIVCADADIEAAARGATAGALINGGQDCTAATRAYVHRSVYDAFLARTAELFDGVRVGDPFDPSTDLGTLITRHPGRAR